MVPLGQPGVCIVTERVRGKEQGKRHASPRQIVRSDDLVSGSDDSGGGVRSDRAKILYWHWKASGNDGRSVARKKTMMIYQPLLPLLGNHTSYCRRWRYTDSFVLVQLPLAAGSERCSEWVDRPHFSESFCC